MAMEQMAATDDLVAAFSRANVLKWVRATFDSFAEDALSLPLSEPLFLRAGVSKAERLGFVKLARATDDGAKVALPVFLVATARIGRGAQRKGQFACAKHIIKRWGGGQGGEDVPGALFFFRSDAERLTRLSLVTPRDQAATDYKRQSFLLVDDPAKNRTFRKYFDGTTVTTFGRPGEKVRGGARSLLARFSVEALTKEFYNELYGWYEWAAEPKTGVRFPDAAGADGKVDLAKTKEHLIRLITRLMFVWFVRERGLVPDELFDDKWLGKELLRDFTPGAAKDGTYYNAILQNLFFATLNQPIEHRAFADDKAFQGKSKTYGVNTLFRDCGTGGGKPSSWFRLPHERVVKVFASVPYLNGGLFECLDTENEANNNRKVYRDGFSCRADSRAFLPNRLFFGDAGLLPLLKRYDFTLDENHASDADIALDPELLGKVFENLLASNDPKTGKTARKASGSFYTPREIVDYMVDEALRTTLARDFPKETVDVLFETDFSKREAALAKMDAKNDKEPLIACLRSLKIIDPACGSGAFPMGILNRVVDLLGELGDKEDVYHRKLHVLENGIYGVDIQPIAVQISKLRFFISLLCDQEVKKGANNSGLNQLPNLEFHLVIADSLIPLSGTSLLVENDVTVKQIRAEILALQAKFSRVYSRQEKVELKCKERTKRLALTKRYEELGFGNEAAQLDKWEPHNPGSVSPFFDPAKMFGIEHFDIVIGNPPYVVVEANDLHNVTYGQLYSCAKGGKKNLYRLFFERGLQLVRDGGCLSYITPNTFLSGTASVALRQYFFRHTTILSLLEYSEKEKVFENVTQAVVVSVMLKQKAKPGHIVRMRTARQGFCEDEQAALAKQGSLIPADLVMRRVQILHKRLVNFSTIAQGDLNLTTCSMYFSDSYSSGRVPMWRGVNVGRFVPVSQPREYCDPKATRSSTWKAVRLMVPQIVNQASAIRAKACIAPANTLCGNSCNTVVFANPTAKVLAYWLGILNSRVFDYLLTYSCHSNHILVKELEQIPVPSPTSASVALLAPIVEAIVERKTRDYAADTVVLEERLNREVYRLYGLTAEEVALVERSFGRGERKAEAAGAAPAAEDDEEEA